MGLHHFRSKYLTASSSYFAADVAQAGLPQSFLDWMRVPFAVVTVVQVHSLSRVQEVPEVMTCRTKDGIRHAGARATSVT